MEESIHPLGGNADAGVDDGELEQRWRFLRIGFQFDFHNWQNKNTLVMDAIRNDSGVGGNDQPQICVRQSVIINANSNIMLLTTNMVVKMARKMMVRRCFSV